MKERRKEGNDEKIFCMHGGLSPELQNMEQIKFELNFSNAKKKTVELDKRLKFE